MMKTGKNKRLLASILAASMLLAMSPFALALADETEGTTGQEQSTSQPAGVSTTGNTTDPGTTDPGTADPGTADPGTPDPGTTEQEKPETPENAAKIGENKYPTIADAIDAAQPGDTIELLGNVTENIKINKSLTLDLGGFTLSGDGKKTVVSISGKDKDMDVTVKNGTITGGYEIKGGGFDIQSGNIKIEKCIIEKNTAKAAGGGVNIGGSANVTITGSEIRNNTVTGSSGGAIYLASGSAYDGYYYNCVCEVVDTKLNGNSAVIGGAVGMGASLFHDGIDNAYGGKGVTATFMMDGESIIDGNTAKYGGAVHLTGVGSRFLMKNGTITNNKATSTEGGAIWATNFGGVTIEKGTISNNTAKRNGGAIYMKANIGEKNPSAKLAIATGVRDVLNLGEVLITNNSAKQGGGIYIDSYDSAYGIQADLKQASIYNNHASDGADDIYSTGKGTEGCTVQLGETADSWKLDCGDTVDNWYIDIDQMGEGTARWNAHPGNGAAYVVPYTQRENLKGVLTLKAAHPLMYTLTYDVTGDLPAGYTAPAKQTLVNGSSYTVAAVPASVSGSKDGVNGTFSFNGWKKDDGTVLTGEQKLTENLTLYGVWTFTKNSSGGGTDPIKWDVSRSKTATKLDTNTWTSNVTLSLPSAEEKLASDVVFVLDKSTSAEMEAQALDMLTELKKQTAKTEAKVKVGVVIFNKQANVTAPLTDLATGSETIEDAIKQKIKSGTNTHAGMLAGKQMLDEDTEVAANRKYLIFVSDGITYMYNAEPTVTAWSFFADAWKHWAGPDNWDSKYGSNNPPADWSAWMTEIGKQVETQGTEYEYPYDGTAEKWTPEDDSSKNYANSIDKALYLTYQVYQEAQEAGYNCYAVANEVESKYLWGPDFMRYLANGETVNFDKIQNDILYAVSAGSTVTDTIGEKFTFGGVDSFTLKVGTKEIKGVKDASDENTVNFGEKKKDGKYPYTVTYTPATKTFVWTINENVSNFAPVQLTYTVKLTKPETAPGTYGTEDLKGEKNVSADKALFTNKSAVLKAINSAGAPLNPLDFPKPSVSYTVKKSSSGGSGGGGGRKPTVTIPDDVPTGLNGDDHYAYIVGYPNGNVEPNGNITRAEVATIFFRLLTEKVRTANSTQSNSLSDVTRGQWFNHAVSTLSSMGIVKGHNDGTFAPNAPITRAEFAAIAARFDDKNRDTSSKFTDIASHWAKNEIGIAANKGWINGYPDGTFRPNQYITRAEAMTLVNRVLNRLPENSSDLLNSMIKWPDNSDASAWYYLAVQEATNSHYYKTKENKFEKWTELRKTRDWTELEK